MLYFGTHILLSDGGMDLSQIWSVSLAMIVSRK